MGNAAQATGSGLKTVTAKAWDAAITPPALMTKGLIDGASAANVARATALKAAGGVIQSGAEAAAAAGGSVTRACGAVGGSVVKGFNKAGTCVGNGFIATLMSIRGAGASGVGGTKKALVIVTECVGNNCNAVVNAIKASGRGVGSTVAAGVAGATSVGMIAGKATAGAVGLVQV